MSPRPFLFAFAALAMAFGITAVTVSPAVASVGERAISHTECAAARTAIFRATK